MTSVKEQGAQEVVSDPVNAQPPAVQGSTNVVQHQSTSGQSLVASIIEAARDPNMDVSKLERLMALREKMDSDQNRIEFASAMNRAQAKIVPVVKNKKNAHTNSTYANLDAIIPAIMPIISECGLSLSFGTASSPLEGHYRITCDVRHNAGHVEHYDLDLPVDSAGSGGKVNKTGVQAYGSTMSYGRRYLTAMIFNLATSDDNDGNATQHRPAKPVPAKLVKAFKKCSSMDSLSNLWSSLTTAERKVCAELKDEQKKVIASADKEASNGAS